MEDGHTTVQKLYQYGLQTSPVSTASTDSGLANEKGQGHDRASKKAK
jgi:hypothetical protein